MGIFGFVKSKAMPAATMETLPSDEKAVYDLSQKYYKADDYASEAICLEKLLTMPPTIPNKYETKTYYPFAAEQLVKLYERGKVAPKDMEKARAAHSAHVKCLFARMGNLFYEAVFEVFCSPLFCSTSADHERIFQAAAEGIVWFRDYDRTRRKGQISTDSLSSFELLRGLLHLSESGMKHVVGKDALLTFLSSPKEPEDIFWYGWPYDWNYMTVEELRPLVMPKSYLRSYEYHRAIRKNLDKNLTLAQKDIKCAEIWKKEFPDLPDYYAQEKSLLEQFEAKYGTMTAQELLDSLYADEAAWQEAHSAEAKAAELAAEAARKAEEQRIARGEKLYRDAILMCNGFGDKKEGIAAMREAAELGNERAKLWLLKQDAESGDAEALCVLGDLAISEQGDELSAYDYYLTAAGQGSGRAAAKLAEFFRIGTSGMAPNEAEAERFLQLAAKQGHGPSCLTLAERCVREKDWMQAVLFLGNALNAGEPDVIMAAIAMMADLYRQQGDMKKALEYAIRFAELDYAQEPEDKGWEQNRAGALRGDIEALEKMWRFYCLYHESGPAERHLGRITLGYRHRVGMVFSEAYCAALRPLAEADNLEACTLLSMHCIDIGEVQKGHYWATKPMAAEYPKMLHYALLYAEEWGLSSAKVQRFREVLATSGTMYAENAKIELDLEAHEAAKQKAHARMVRECQESQRQAAIDEKMGELHRKMDQIERNVDMLFTGEGLTVDERAILGDVSAKAWLDRQMIRDDVEEKFRKKLEE